MSATIETLVSVERHNRDRRAATRPHRQGVGEGYAHVHHGEILQGVFETGGRLRRALVTLPCPLYASRATFRLTRTADLTVVPRWKTKAQAAARIALDAIGLHDFGGRLAITTSIPVCRGFGSSTGDVSAAVRAVLTAAQATMSDAEIARVAVRAEIAVDALMFDHAVLFAQREGVVLEDFCVSYPCLAVLGFPTGDGNGVDTLELAPARYASWEIEAFRPLLGMLRRGFARRDAREIGAVATASARLNQSRLPVPQFDALLDVARRTDAAGLQVAHSGDIAGLIYDRDDPFLPKKIDAARTRLARLGVDDTWFFCSCSHEAWRPDATA